MKAQYKVLCIGVNDARVKELKPLKYAESDAHTVAKHFEALDWRAEVKMMLGKNATRSSIFDWLNQCNRVQDELIVVLYFAGHGSAIENQQEKKIERCLWIDSNERPTIEDHQLKTTEILDILKNPLHKLIFIIDTCYSPWPVNRKFNFPEIFRKFKESERIISFKRYVIISASAVNRSAYEDPAIGQGVLTHYFLKAISGKFIFFTKKQISIFQLIQQMDVRVKTHMFTIGSGRKKLNLQLMYNGIVVHNSAENFLLPVLEPTPLIIDRNKRPFQQKISHLVHFLVCTRFRTKMSLLCSMLISAGLLLYLAHISTVRIHFQPPQYAAFHHTLLGQQRYSLEKLKGERLGKDRYKEFNLYLFKHNWVNVLLSKLDAGGKIILTGNLLGEKINGINGKQMVEFALRNNNDVFYWHPGDVMKLLEELRENYKTLSKRQKQETLKLLAILGEKGTAAAKQIFNFQQETDQELRNLFLKHFYSIDFLEDHFDDFKQYDYLLLLNQNKNLPPAKNSILQEKTNLYLNSVSRSIPSSQIPVTSTQKLEEVYDNLRILAAFGSKQFREKASHVFKNAFDPDQVYYLFNNCKNIADKAWVLDQYFSKAKTIDSPFGSIETFWSQLIYNSIYYLPKPAKARIIKVIIDNTLDQVPRTYRFSLFNYLRDTGSRLITLRDWENWMLKYRIEPQFIFYTIIDMDYETVFGFLDRHYGYFQGLFSEEVFRRLYRLNETRTVNLAKKIFKTNIKTNNRKDQLHAAVFLFNQNRREYSSFIAEFLEKSRDNEDNQQLLNNFYGRINEAAAALIGNNENLKQDLKLLLNSSHLFYRFFKTNLQFWPAETIQRVSMSEIPQKHIDGIPFLRICEQLPDPYRKKMLVKICRADIDETFRLNAETTLVKHFPGEFLDLVFNSEYNWERFTGRQVIEAYRSFSYERLKEELIVNLNRKTYWKINFICEALISKNAKKELNHEEIKRLLTEFSSPSERILLRKLRHYLHQHNFGYISQ